MCSENHEAKYCEIKKRKTKETAKQNEPTATGLMQQTTTGAGKHKLDTKKLPDQQLNQQKC